jgi:hypothetical protein
MFPDQTFICMSRVSHTCRQGHLPFIDLITLIILKTTIKTLTQGINALSINVARSEVWLTKSVVLEPEGSSPHSQKPATDPYPGPVEATPHTPSKSPQDPFWSHPPIYTSVFRVDFFIRDFAPKPCTLFSPVPFVPHVPPISFSLIWSA